MAINDRYTTTNDSDGKPTNFRVWIDKNMILLFAGNTFTNHAWKPYRDLSPVARRLADYIESNKHPYALKIETFRKMCDSNCTALTGWRRTVRQACAELVARKIVKYVKLESDDCIYVVRS